MHKGPVFTELLLADEINRTSPKTQSALLEAMEERQVSLDGQRHALPEVFLSSRPRTPLNSTVPFRYRNLSWTAS
nr:AAA family ATPase [Aliamphritea spongicola]